MNRFLAFLLLGFAGATFAGSDSFVVALSKGPTPVSVVLDVPADYVAVPIVISSNEKDPLRNHESIQAFSQRLKDSAAKSPTIKLRQGALSLSIAVEDGSFSKSASLTSSSSMYLVAPLQNDRDIFLISQDIAAFVQSMEKPEQIRVRFGMTSLGIEAPERFRPRLLALMSKDLEQTRSAIGNPKSFEISGLENPVAVMLRDDRNLTIYIPYRLKLGQ